MEDAQKITVYRSAKPPDENSKEKRKQQKEDVPTDPSAKKANVSEDSKVRKEYNSILNYR